MLWFWIFVQAIQAIRDFLQVFVLAGTAFGLAAALVGRVPKKVGDILKCGDWRQRMGRAGAETKSRKMKKISRFESAVLTRYNLTRGRYSFWRTGNETTGIPSKLFSITVVACGS